MARSMKLVVRYGIGPYYNTEHLVNEIRQVYRHAGATVYLDWLRNRHHAELFAFVDNGPLWCLGEFSAQSWDAAERKAEGMVDRWMEAQ